MTIICVRDGIMSVDSVAYLGETLIGAVVKWRTVPPEHGGGFIACSGEIAPAMSAMDQVCNGDLAFKLSNCSLVWIKADRSVTIFEDGGHYAASAPFYARGSGREVAIGAMAMGATAEKAANIACAHVAYCGGEIHVLRLDATP